MRNIEDYLPSEEIRRQVPWRDVSTVRYVLALVAKRKTVERVNKNIAQQLVEAGVADGTDFIQYDQLDFQQRCELLAKHGVFTVARSPGEEFEELPVIKQRENEAKQTVGRSKVRQGRYIAENVDCPQEVTALLKRLREHLGVRSTQRAEAS